jgi:hypothetical protein
METPVYKMKEFILYDHFLDKNLFRFFQFHLHLIETNPAKSGLKPEKMEA